MAFGARALDDQAQPKYLNSPETKLFDKGSTVFNFAHARARPPSNRASSSWSRAIWT